MGVLYEHLDRFYEEIVQILLPLLRDKNPQMRYEVLITLEHIVSGLGPISQSIHREIYHIVKAYLCDRVMSIRTAAAMVSFSFKSLKRIIFLFFL